MRIAYQTINLRSASLVKIARANGIIAEYAAQGFTLTLRQLYYQHVARGLIDNNEREYKRLGDLISNGRLAGMIDWNAIQDRTRFLRDLSHWDHPKTIVETCAKQFRLPKWENQPCYCEVWIEKDALLGVIEGICSSLDVPYLACRGYASASEVWRAGHERFRHKLAMGKDCTVFYLGDHDPSGLDMSRDVQDRLDLFTRQPGQVVVKRLALNMSQVDAHNPPPNPTKLSDSRAEGYMALYGETCWELDALPPATISDLVRNEILAIRDDDEWNSCLVEEERYKRQLASVANEWDNLDLPGD